MCAKIDRDKNYIYQDFFLGFSFKNRFYAVVTIPFLYCKEINVISTKSSSLYRQYFKVQKISQKLIYSNRFDSIRSDSM